VQRWSGYVFGVTFLMAFVISPFWGRFGENGTIMVMLAEIKKFVIQMTTKFFLRTEITSPSLLLSLYIETISPHSGGYVQRWSGYVFGVTFLMAFVISPSHKQPQDKQLINGCHKPHQ
jgi:hypothetical protein